MVKELGGKNGSGALQTAGEGVWSWPTLSVAVAVEGALWLLSNGPRLECLKCYCHLQQSGMLSLKGEGSGLKWIFSSVPSVCWGCLDILEKNSHTTLLLPPLSSSFSFLHSSEGFSLFLQHSLQQAVCSCAQHLVNSWPVNLIKNLCNSKTHLPRFFSHSFSLPHTLLSTIPVDTVTHKHTHPD